MSDIVFKRLFEVQILHDYFLTMSDDISFFDKTRVQREELLIKKQQLRAYDIRKLLHISTSDLTQLNMNKYRLRMALTSLGFIIGIEVKTETIGGEVVYKPAFEFPADLRLNFFVEQVNPLFRSMSNLTLRPKLSSLYYFTNKGKEVHLTGTPPSQPWLPISKKTPEHQPGLEYEMGSVVNFGGNIKQAIQFTDGSVVSHWQNTIDRRLVTDADNILLPRKIKYPVQSGVTQISAVLEDGGSVIKSITETIDPQTASLELDFSVIDETAASLIPIDNGFYTLKITEDSNPEITYEVHLHDELYSKYLLGVIDIDFSENSSPFALLDTNGFLVTRIDSLANKIPHPIFELRFANRQTYWRYQNEDGFEPSDIAATSGHLQVENGKLVSKKPKGLTKTLVPFNGGTPLILPPPERPSIKVENDRIFSEIFINQSNRLLNN